MYGVSPGVELVLASGSPRRREMLAGLGLRFAVSPTQVEEKLVKGESLAPTAVRLARLKAQAHPRQPGQAVLAADTLVGIQGSILGKPADPEEAKRMLASLSGREHQVVTGFCLLDDQGQSEGLGKSTVRFRPLRAAEIEAYVATGEPMDKAGAYAVQGIGSVLVEAVNGSYTNVVGLPLNLVVELMLSRGLIRVEETA